MAILYNRFPRRVVVCTSCTRRRRRRVRVTTVTARERQAQSMAAYWRTKLDGPAAYAPATSTPFAPPHVRIAGHRRRRTPPTDADHFEIRARRVGGGTERRFRGGRLPRPPPPTKSSAAAAAADRLRAEPLALATCQKLQYLTF